MECSDEGIEPEERFTALWRTQGVEYWSPSLVPRCISLLDEVGGPRNVTAYFSVLRSLRRLVGWGSRTRGAKGWLKPLEDWPLLCEIYRWTGWVTQPRVLFLAGITERAPVFLQPGYATIFNGMHDYRRLPELFVLATLVRRGLGTDIGEFTSDLLIAKGSFAALDKDLSSGLSWDERRLLRSNTSPRGMCEAYMDPLKMSRWRWSPEGQEIVHAIATIGLRLAELVPDDPTPPVTKPPSEGNKRRRGKSGRRRRGGLARFPRVDEILRLPLIIVRDAGSTPDGIHPEDAEQVEFALESGEQLLEETPDGSAHATRPKRLRLTPERRRAFVTARQRHKLDALLVLAHPLALSKSEVQPIVANLLADALSASTSGHRSRLGANLMLLVIAVAACSTQQVRQIRYALLADALRENGRDQILITPEGYLVRSAPLPPEHYRPPADATGLVDVGRRVLLRLPEALCNLITAWVKLESIDPSNGSARLFPPATDPAQRLISRQVEVIRGRTNIMRLTAQRLANTLPPLLMEAEHDVTIVQMVTGDAHGLSLAGCAYCSARMADLQAAFDAGIEAMGFSRAVPKDTLCTLRVGSALCLQDDFVSERVKRLGYGLNYLTTRFGRLALTERIQWHNRMTLYTGRLLEACLGTRFHRTIGELKLSDVALETGWLVVADKRTDVAHAARAVVVSGLALAQLRAYASHLDALSQHPGLPRAIQRDMRDALTGDRALLFFIDGDMPIAWTGSALLRFDPEWRWPSNTMRHRAATHLREQGCPGDFVAAQLGHADLGHMLGMDSPTSPAQFQAAISRAVDAYARRDGWSVQRGFGSGVWSEVLRLPTVRSVRRIWVKLEKQERGYLRGQCAVWTPADSSERSILHREIADLLETRVQALAAPEAAPACAEDAAAANDPPHLDYEFTTALRKAVAAQCLGDGTKVEWALGELRELMLEGERDGRWQCGDRRRVIRILLEPSPVAVGMVDSHRVYCTVRTWYEAALPTGMQSTGAATHWCWLVMGWALVDGFTDRTDLEAMLRGLGKAHQPAKHSDSVLIPLEFYRSSTAQATAIHGVTAAIAARVHHRIHTVLDGAPPAGKALWDTLENWLRATLPARLQPLQEGSVLTWLLEVTRLALRFEIPGLLRALRGGTFTPTALNVERMIHALDTRPPSLPKAIPVFPSQIDSTRAEIVDGKANEGTRGMLTFEHELRIILRKMSLAEYTTERGIEASVQAVRADRIERIEALLQRAQDQCDAVRLVLRYALKLLKHGTPFKSRLADSTVYMYACDVAAAFTRLGQDVPEDDWRDLDSKALESLYRDLVATSSNPRLREHLRYFQAFAEEHQGLPPVSKSTVLNGARVPARVDANLVTLREYLSAHALLAKASKFHRLDAWISWHLRAARVAMVLMYRGTLRIGEVAGRLHGDLMIIDGKAIVSVHRTQFGGLKSTNARRVVCVSDGLTAQELDLLREWLADTKLPWQKKRRASLAPLFPAGLEGDQQMQAMQEGVLEMFIGAALRAATGDPAAVAHWLRHSAASYGALHSLGSSLAADSGRSSTDQPLRRCEIVRLAASLGHGSISTTFTSYIHTLPLVSFVRSRWESAYTGSDVAAILGIPHALLRRKRADLKQRGRSADELVPLVMRRYWRNSN